MELSGVYFWLLDVERIEDGVDTIVNDNEVETGSIEEVVGGGIDEATVADIFPPFPAPQFPYPG